MIDGKSARLQSVRASLEESLNTTPDNVEGAIYYEAHITLDPVLDMTQLGNLAEILTQHEFRLAKLYMDKGKPSTLDSFATSRDSDVAMLLGRSRQTVLALADAGFNVRRCKIEAALIDVRWKM